MSSPATSLLSTRSKDLCSRRSTALSGEVKENPAVEAIDEVDEKPTKMTASNGGKAKEKEAIAAVKAKGGIEMKGVQSTQNKKKQKKR